MKKSMQWLNMTTTSKTSVVSAKMTTATYANARGKLNWVGASAPALFFSREVGFGR